MFMSLNHVPSKNDACNKMKNSYIYKTIRDWIDWNMKENPNPYLITPAQIRAGRALLGWSQEDLAEKSDVSVTSIRDLENERRGGGAGEARTNLCRTLASAGIEFINAAQSGDAGPGVRLRGQPPRVLRQPRKPGAFNAMHIPVEWRGEEYLVLVPHDVLSDLGRFPKSEAEDAYLKMFERHRVTILEAAARAIDGGRTTPDARVYVTHEDLGLR